MSHHALSSNRNVRTFIASLLSYILLTSQLAPMALAFNWSAARSAPAETSDSGRKKVEVPRNAGNASNPFAPVPVPLSVAPAALAANISATKVDSFADSDSDGKAEPGEVITYSIQITNGGPDPALNVTLSDTVDPNTTIVPGSVHSTPLAFADAYSVLGNVRIQVPDGPSDLLANDVDPENVGNTNAGLTVTTLGGDTSAPFDGTSANGGNVTATTGDGSFQYNPPPGFTGTDTFTYTVTDSTGGGTDTATVTLNVSGMIWFIDDSAAPGGDGRLTTPFNCFVGTSCFDDSTLDEAGDNIFLFNGAYIGGQTLLASQKLIGQGATATLASIASVTVPTFSDPLPVNNGNPANVTITTTAPATNGITLGSGNTLRGFTIGNTTGSKIFGNAFGTLTAGNNTTPDLVLNGTGQALNLQTGTFAATSAFNSVTTTSSTAQGVSLSTVAGTVSFGATTISGSTSQGIVVNANSTANFNFGNTSVTGGTIGIHLVGSPLATFTFGTLSISDTSQAAFQHVISSGTTTVTGVTTITNPGGRGIWIDAAAGSVTFANTNVMQSGGTGVFVNANSGTVTFADLDISPDAGQIGLQVAGSTGTITTTSGDITTTGNVAVDIIGVNAANRTPLNMTLDNISSTNSSGLGVNLNFVSGNLTVAGAGTDTDIQNPTGIGIQVQNTGAGTLNFGDTVVNLSGGTGVFLNANTSAITFADIDISPDSGQRPFHATSNTGVITSTSGAIPNSGMIAVEIVGVSAASRTPLNMQLTSVSASSVANGIILQNTTTSGSPGGFVVNGDGTNTTVGGNGTGGTISNMSGGDGAIAGNGVYMENANGVTLRRMTINGTNQNHGIRGINSSNLTLEFSTVSGTNGTSTGLDEGSVNFDNLTVSATITSCVIEGGLEDNLNVVNTTGTLNRLTITGSTFGFNNTVSGNNNILIESQNAGTVLNFTLQSSTIKGARADWLNASNNSSSTMDAVIGGSTPALGNTFDNLAANAHAGAAAGGNRLVMGAVGTQTVDIRNNTLKGSKGEAIRVRTTASGALTGTVDARVRDNVIGVQATANSGSSEGSGIFAFGDGGGDMDIAITNNQVFQYNNHGILVQFGDEINDGSVFNATVTGNTVNTPGTINTDFNAIHLNNGTVGASDNFTSCVDVGGAGVFNVVTNGGKGTIFPNNADIRLRQRQSTTVRLPGYVGPARDNTDNEVAEVDTYLAGRNTLLTSAANSVSTGGGYIGGAACTQPSFSAPETLTDEIPGPGGDVHVPGAPGNIGTPGTSEPTSITSRPFLSSPRQQTALATTAAGRSVPAVESREITPPKPADLPKPQEPVITGDTITWNIGTLPAGDSITITFQVTVDNPFNGALPQVSNQGQVTADGGINVQTDDPSEPGSANPTVTLIDEPPDIRVNDATAPEPPAGSSNMLFTVTLSAPSASTVTVNFTTADEPAGPGKAVAGLDYTTTNGTVTFTAGQVIQTIAVPILSDADNTEPNETFLLNLTGATGGVIVDGQAVGTITAANPAGTVLISELRTSGPNGGTDDFVEIYNNTDTPLTVAASDASAGYGVFKMGADCNATPVLLGIIPNGTVIPARGHYLLVGSGYSLTNYGGSGAAAGNLTMSSDIENDRNVSIFSTANVLNLGTVNRLDAVGFGTNTGNLCDLQREGTNLGATGGSTTQHSFFRKLCDHNGSACSTPGTAKDTNDNAADFLFADTAGTSIPGLAQRLGAPGPENLASPIKRDSSFSLLLLDQTVPGPSPPNRFRDLTSDPGNNSTFGTMSIRRRVVNNTGAPITRLRFRIVEFSTFPAPSPAGTADLRARTSLAVTVSNINDPATCLASTGSATTPCTVTVQGTTLEQPPTQASGGGLNSTLAAGTITTGTPLANGASINLQFLMGVQTTGTFRFLVIIEALP